MRTCAPRPSFSRPSRCGENARVRIASIRVHGGKKNGRMYRRRLSPRRVNTRPRVRARATRALGQWRNFSRFFLLPFCIGPAFRIYLRVIRFAAGYNTRPASGWMRLVRGGGHRRCCEVALARFSDISPHANLNDTTKKTIFMPSLL